MTTQVAVVAAVTVVCVAVTANTVILVLAVRGLLQLAFDRAKDLTQHTDVSVRKTVDVGVRRRDGNRSEAGAEAADDVPEARP